MEPACLILWELQAQEVQAGSNHDIRNWEASSPMRQLVTVSHDLRSSFSLAAEVCSDRGVIVYVSLHLDMLEMWSCPSRKQGSSAGSYACLLSENKTATGVPFRLKEA